MPNEKKRTSLARPTKTKAPSQPIPARIEPKDLGRTQELIAESVSEMLTSGGHPSDIDALLRASMSHTRRRTFGFAEDPALIASSAEEFIKEKFEDWKNDLAIGWKHNERQDAAAFEPKTLTELIRASNRDGVRRLFEGAIGRASSEELTF